MQSLMKFRMHWRRKPCADVTSLPVGVRPVAKAHATTRIFRLQNF